jgi:hypothetical protein
LTIIDQHRVRTGIKQEPETAVIRRDSVGHGGGIGIYGGHISSSDGDALKFRNVTTNPAGNEKRLSAASVVDHDTLYREGADRHKSAESIPQVTIGVNPHTAVAAIDPHDHGITGKRGDVR